jgi:hypothetical protein
LFGLDSGESWITLQLPHPLLLTSVEMAIDAPDGLGSATDNAIDPSNIECDWEFSE